MTTASTDHNPQQSPVLDISWQFPADLHQLNGRLDRVYKAFRASSLDQFCKRARQEEEALNSQNGSQLVSLRAHRRALVYEARRVLEKIPFDRHESFWLVDLSRVAYKLRQWNHQLPNVRPYYAVKCNTNPGILHVMAVLGGGFDCASREELHSVLHTLVLVRKHRETSADEVPSLRALPDVNESRPDFAFWKESQDEQDDDDGGAGSSPSAHKRAEKQVLEDPDFRREVASRIIFTHSIKEVSHIKYARKIGVQMTVADNEVELRKLHKFWPAAQVILRVVADDRNSISAFSTKFGATKAQLRDCLIPLARELGLDVIGVSFHAGSLSKDPPAFYKAISDARLVFDWLRAAGYTPRLLDLGGGYPGTAAHSVSFETFAAEVRRALHDCFFADGSYSRDTLHLAGEPGRFIVADTHALVTSIVGARDTTHVGNPPLHPDFCDSVPERLDQFQYYINDGVYGGLNKYQHDKKRRPHIHSVPLSASRSLGLQMQPSAGDGHKKMPEKEKEKKKKEGEEEEEKVRDEEAAYHREELFESTIFGQTCDSNDVAAAGVLLPRLQVGDALVFTDSGAYTTASSSHFNGFSDDRLLYVFASDEADPSVLEFHRERGGSPSTTSN